jgi:hypothetical protein
MAARYIAIHVVSNWNASATADFVIVEDTPTKTGLLDATGTPLYRLPLKEPAGFALPTAAYAPAPKR